jgi:hypothetical protein
MQSCRYTVLLTVVTPVQSDFGQPEKSQKVHSLTKFEPSSRCTVGAVEKKIFGFSDNGDQTRLCSLAPDEAAKAWRW